jgi:hypothetical protein
VYEITKTPSSRGFLLPVHFLTSIKKGLSVRIVFVVKQFLRMGPGSVLLSHGAGPHWLGRSPEPHTIPTPVTGRRVSACANTFHFLPDIKKGLSVRIALSSNGTWQCATLTWGNPTLPSPLIRFTSEFGMGSGGTVSLWLPGKTFCKRLFA